MSSWLDKLPKEEREDLLKYKTDRVQAMYNARSLERLADHVAENKRLAWEIVDRWLKRNGYVLYLKEEAERDFRRAVEREKNKAKWNRELGLEVTKNQRMWERYWKKHYANSQVEQEKKVKNE